MSKKGGFAENDSLKENFKASLFKNLFKERKKLLDGYPAVAKGLAFPEPSVKVGGAAYTFKTSDVVDKITCKSGDKEFNARYKKTTKEWDLSMKQKINSEVSVLCKYEERSQGSPCYVVGADFNKFGILSNFKYNPFTGNLKGSMLYNAKDVVEGVTLGLDFKGTSACLADINHLKFNIGASYDCGSAGVAAVAFNNRGMLTLNHMIQMDKKLAFGLEFVQPTNQLSLPANPLTMGASYKVDSEHEIRARLNKKGDLNICIDKKFGPGFNLLFATVVNVAKPDVVKAPSFGFKVVAK